METAVDESRKETAERVATYQADYTSICRTCLCYSCRQLLQLVRTWSPFVFLFFLRLILRDFHFIALSFFLVLSL